MACIIHSAWAVNFNLGVRSFEDQHIRGTYNLINFCLRSQLGQPARFFFCSSISAASGTPKPATIPETAVEDLRHAQGTGYGRSKLVTEHITRNAMRSTGMHARVLRIGQLSGDRHSAMWNDTEAVALMFRSALTTGSLPELDEEPSWLPVDQCAEAIVDLALADAADSNPDLVYHLVNPQRFSWKNDLLPALKQRSKLPHFDVVSPQEWLERLARSEQDPAKNPSMKLIDYWRLKYGTPSQPEEVAATDGAAAQSNDDDAVIGLAFETKRTTRDCPVLNAVRDPVSDGLMERYIDAWLRRWTGA